MQTVTSSFSFLILLSSPILLFLSETWFDGTMHIIPIELTKGEAVYLYMCLRKLNHLAALNHLTTVTDDIETCAVRISVSPRVSLDIIGLYRPPRGNPIEFNNKLYQMIFNNNSIKTIILGNLNLNLLNLNDSHTADLLNNMQSLSYRPLINKPTRSTMNSATCIDHIWTNNSSNHISGF